MKTRLPLFVFLVLGSSLGLVGCGDVDDGLGVGCTEIAAASVSVQVVDGSGMPVSEATVTFSVNGGPAQNCETFMSGSYVCGYEQAGMITITATNGTDTQMQTVTVTKTADGCHVQGQSITITLGA